VVVWDNSVEQDLGVYGRYQAIERCARPVIYVQDDDCLVDDAAIALLLAAYEPGMIVANMPESRWDDYPDSCLVGWGAVFDRDLPDQAFIRFGASDAAGADEFLGMPDDFFHRTCDVVFTTLTPHRKIDAGFFHLPWAEDPERAMFLQPGHREQRDRMLHLARQVRDDATVASQQA
jgi:hypothetical protein